MDSLSGGSPFWYDGAGKLTGIAIRYVGEILCTRPKSTQPFPVKKRPMFDEQGRQIGWETSSGGCIF